MCIYNPISPIKRLIHIAIIKPQNLELVSNQVAWCLPAPSITNLCMEDYEATSSFGCDSPFMHKILSRYQYIDNVFCIFADRSSVDGFQKWVNELNFSIKFDFHSDVSAVPFLDTVL